MVVDGHAGYPSVPQTPLQVKRIRKMVAKKIIYVQSGSNQIILDPLRASQHEDE